MIDKLQKILTINRKGNDNMKSYAWVLRALWKIGEEVKDDMFPAIFDNKAIEFFISVTDITCR